MAYGGLGAPGTKITRQLGADSDLWLYVKQAVAIMACSDAILTVLILTVLTAGWWLLPILFLAFGALVGLAGLAFSNWFRVGMPLWAERILGNLWALIGIAGIAVGLAWRFVIDPAFDLLAEQIGAFFLFPWWWYVAGALVAIVVAVWLKKWIVLVIVPVGEIIAGLVVAAEPGAYAEIWHALRWVLLVYTWPIAGAAFVLGLVLLKEMGWPSAEFTLKPIDVEKLGPGGLWSFYFPWLIKEPPKAPPMRMARVEFKEGHKTRYDEFPDDANAWAFYQAVRGGASFSLATALSNKVAREVFNKLIRDAFLDRHWAKWRNERHHDQGVELKGQGKAAIRALALLPRPTESEPHA